MTILHDAAPDVLVPPMGRVPVPSDPTIPLTTEQLDAVFGGSHRIDALRDLIVRLREKRGDHDDTA